MPYVHVGIHPTNGTVPHAKAIVNSNIALVAPVSQFGICNQFSVSVSAQGAGDSAQTWFISLSRHIGWNEAGN